MKTASERFWSQVLVDPASGCWLWQGHLVSGYGQIRHEGRRPYAHVWAWEQLNGPVPEGLELDGFCDQLDERPVTHRENVLRGKAPTAANLAKIECVRGHEFNEENTLVRGDGRGRECRPCRRLHQAGVA